MVVHRDAGHDGSRRLKAMAVIAAVVLVLVVATFVALMLFGQRSGHKILGGSVDQTLLAKIDQPEMDPYALSGKLNGATETIDENGIVHGVMPNGTKYTVRGRGERALAGDKVTLIAAGDQIGTDNSLPIADRYAGSAGDGEYSFVPFYQEVAPIIQAHDLRFINQETVMDSSQPYSGYPIFNTPEAAAEAIAEVGFNLVNFASNHIYDKGEQGILRSHEVFDRFPQLLVAGSFTTPEDRDTVQMIERNGITFALLDYTYGDNHYAAADSFPNDYYLCGFDPDVIAADVRRAQEVADVVIVGMHWGTEYVNEPNDQQWEYAQLLADLNVDLVLGTHCHTIQPVKYLTGSGGNVTPVAFGLSDFVSGWTLTDTIISGLFTCEFVRDPATFEVSVENVELYPTIEWSDGGDVYVRRLCDMSVDEINANTRTEDVSNDYDHLTGLLDSLGCDCPVIVES